MDAELSFTNKPELTPKPPRILEQIHNNMSATKNSLLDVQIKLEEICSRNGLTPISSMPDGAQTDTQSNPNETPIDKVNRIGASMTDALTRINQLVKLLDSAF